ncbi:hypothetical protein [Streptomyces sp. NPDC002758]
MTKKDTANAALSEDIGRNNRRLALARLAARVDVGEFDVLLDKQNYRDTERSSPSSIGVASTSPRQPGSASPPVPTWRSSVPGSTGP